MKRVVIPELLDSDSGTPDEIAASLLDLQGINQKFGGIATLESMIERVFRARKITSFSLLEAAAGAGYVPESASQRLKARGIQCEVTLLDRAKSHLPPSAVKNSAGVMASANAVVGDALALPFRDASFDLVDSTLFVHHLSPEEVVKFVNEGLRVSRIAVLINDVVRHPLHLALVNAARPLFRSRMTRHDAVASVRRAYTPSEMTEMLRQTSAVKIGIQRHYLFRMGVIVWKR
jgi:ubiquinone/menaquinone biosynthesis C-methylase UbiE